MPLGRPPKQHSELLNLNNLKAGSLIATLTLGELDVQHTMLHLGLDMVAVDTLGKIENLAERGVGKLAAQEVVLLVLRAILVATTLVAVLIALALLIQADNQLVIAIQLNLKIILGHARCSNLDLELLVGLDNVNRRCRATLGKYLGPLVVEQVAEDARHAI